MLVAVALLVQLGGCGDSGNQQEAPSGKAGATNDMPDLCSFIVGGRFAVQCVVNSRDNVVEITINSFDDEVARNVCADIAAKTEHLAAHLSGQWKLQVFSPYRSDKALAACYLH
ncbi:MAG TPA: hypothetical protein VMJ33_08770 [Gallionella sp.]|nr:hypothetical protein [Gallionella sp.]